MKKLLVCLVSLMAVIMPLSALGADMVHYDLVPVRLIELDDHMKLSGSGSGWLRTNLAATIRQEAVDTGLFRIAVSGSRFSNIARSQDRIHQSGRYRKSSQELVRDDAMIAPTERFEICGEVSISRENQGAIVSAVTSLFGGNSRRSPVRVRAMKSMARVTIVLEPTEINSGISSGRSYEATGTASEYTNVGISGGRSRLSGNNFGHRSPQDELIARAAENAVRDLVRQMSTDYQPEPICSVDILSGKSVWQIGTVISFFRNDKPIASYEILGIGGNTLAVRILKQDRLPKAGDPFKIK